MKISTNKDTWTEVLNGAGFVISGKKTSYVFDTSLDADAFTVNPNNQVNGVVGRILYAKSLSSFGEVNSIPE